MSHEVWWTLHALLVRGFFISFFFVLASIMLCVVVWCAGVGAPSLCSPISASALSKEGSSSFGLSTFVNLSSCLRVLITHAFMSLMLVSIMNFYWLRLDCGRGTEVYMMNILALVCVPLCRPHAIVAPKRRHAVSSYVWHISYNSCTGKGMLYVSNLPSSPSAEVREALMGFQVGDTEAPSLS